MSNTGSTVHKLNPGTPKFNSVAIDVKAVGKAFSPYVQHGSYIIPPVGLKSLKVRLPRLPKDIQTCLYIKRFTRMWNEIF